MIAALIAAAITMTSIQTRTVVDTTASIMDEDQLVQFMNDHADKLRNAEPLEFLVNGSDTTVIVRFWKAAESEFKMARVFGDKHPSWELPTTKRTEVIDTISFSRWHILGNDSISIGWGRGIMEIDTLIFDYGPQYTPLPGIIFEDAITPGVISKDQI